MSMKYCMLLLAISWSGITFGQIVFAAGASGNLYRIELSNCSVQTLGKTNIFADLAMDPTTKELYGINVKGLYKIDTVTGKDTLIAPTIGANAMTFGRDGTLYGASGGSIYTINKTSGNFKQLGTLKFYKSAGDLTFFQGDLYLTVLGNELIRIDLDDVKNSKPMGRISGVRSGVFHGITAVGCKNMYGFAGKDIYEIRPETIRLASMKCPIAVDDYIFGAASYQEAGLPDFSLGKDSSLCAGDTLSYSFKDTLGVYTWQDTLVAPSYNITKPGTYWVAVKYTQCKFKDTVQITVGTQPEIDLGPDTLICPTQKLTLNAYWPGSSYTWQDSTTASGFVVREPGLHWVIATAQNCGSDIDSVYVRFKDKLKPDLGPDQYICDNVPIVLYSNLGATAVRWQNGSINDSFTAYYPGTYWLKGTIGNCAYVDTMRILDNGTSPQVSLGKDTALCYGDTLPLSALTSAIRYQWSNLSETPTIVADSSALYWVIAQSEHCGSDTDSIQVLIYPNLRPNFSGDTVLCDSDTLTLKIDVPGAFIRWQGTVPGDSFLITQPGDYEVKVRLAHCLQADTITVGYDTTPLFDLGPDTVLCGEQLYELRIDSSTARYLWSDNSQTQTKTVDTSGTYWARASSKHCGIHQDTISITFVNGLTSSLGPDTTLCEEDRFRLQLTTEYDSIVWSQGSREPYLLPKDSGAYSALVYRQGCVYSTDTVSVTVYDCNCPLRITNVFSPNGDSYNDGFKPVHECYFTFYHFQIFNRWGQCVFETNDPEEEWKGTLESSPSVYFYVVSYEQYDRQHHKQTGSVMVVR